MASPEITRLLELPPRSQQDSLLFRLPSEIRHWIYKLALADYPDPNPDAQFAASTYYSRPSYSAPRKSSTTLLRTCRQVFQECWFMPFALREQIHYLTGPERMPPDYDWDSIPGESKDIPPAYSWMKSRMHDPPFRWNKRLAETLRDIFRQQGEEVEIESLRLYAQMYKLEEDMMADFMSTPHLHPKKVTLTIRHQDWWWWEDDHPLYFHGWFLRPLGLAMSPSVREVVVELESLDRKRDQVLQIASQMRQRWSIKRSDGVIMYADATGNADETSNWTGCSFWKGDRWVRDETAPKRIEYYVHTVTFRPAQVIERMGGEISPEAKVKAEQQHIMYSSDRPFLHLEAAATFQLGGLSSIPVSDDGQLVVYTDSEDYDDEDDDEDDEEDEDMEYLVEEYEEELSSMGSGGGGEEDEDGDGWEEDDEEAAEEEGDTTGEASGPPAESGEADNDEEQPDQQHDHSEGSITHIQEPSQQDRDQLRMTSHNLFDMMSMREVEIVCDHSTAAEYEAWWYQSHPEEADKPAPLSWWYEKRLAHRGY